MQLLFAAKSQVACSSRKRETEACILSALVGVGVVAMPDRSAEGSWPSLVGGSVPRRAAVPLQLADPLIHAHPTEGHELTVCLA
jgi:hypothetical protein